MNIDGKHDQIMREYQNQNNEKNDQTNIKNLQKELESIDTFDWRKRNSLQKQIKDLTEESQVEELKNKYLLDAASILEEYTSNRQMQVERRSLQTMKEYTLGSFVTSTNMNNKGLLNTKYNNLMNTNVNLKQKRNIEMDAYCECCETKLITIVSEAVIVCPECGKTSTYFDCSSQGMTYEQEISSEVNASFAYKRINHFNEWMAHFQAKDVTQIPQEILDIVMKELKKARIDSIDITEKRIKDILKKLKLNKYYENSSVITNMLNGKSLKTMEPELEEKLRSMFMLIQEPFEKCKPKDRSNFLSYSYCLYKFCELLERDEYLPHFPLLKSREKLQGQDKIWKDICGKLMWEYIPTI